MSLTNPNSVVTEQRLSEFYQGIFPYLGGMPEVVNNKFSKGNLYSTDEKMIGQWIDGRPLYQKTWTGLSLSSNTNWYSTGISIDFVKTIINGFTIDNLEQNISSSYGIDSSTKILYLKNTWNGQIISQITLQYTKTADSPIAIGSDTDYSTNEKIVGTWIDGKPLYQKTWIYNKTTNSEYVLDLSSQSIDIIVNSKLIIIDINGGAIHHDQFYESGTSMCAWFFTTDKKFHQRSGSTNGFGQSYLTLQYTKTTD